MQLAEKPQGGKIPLCITIPQALEDNFEDHDYLMNKQIS